MDGPSGSDGQLPPQGARPSHQFGLGHSTGQVFMNFEFALFEFA
jgi:hypothetical protein